MADNGSYFGVTSKNFDTRRKSYNKKRDEYARKQQLSAQQKIEDDYTQAKINENNDFSIKLAALNKRYGAAANDQAALQALHDEYASLEANHNANLKNIAAARKQSLAATRDTKQYYDGFDEDAFDKALAETKAANDAKQPDTKVKQETPNDKTTGQQEASGSSTAEQQDTKSQDSSTIPNDSMRRYFQRKINTTASTSATDEPEMSARIANYNHAQNKANLHEQLANEEFKAAQKQSQISNRDPRRESGLDAAMSAENKNAQIVANMGNASAGAAALERQVGDAGQFLQQNRDRGDTARKDAVQSFQQGYDDKQRAEQRREEGNIGVLEGYGNQISNTQTDILSMGKTDIEPPQEEQPAPEPQQESTPEPQPEPEAEPEPPDPTKLNVDWQEILNYITYANDPTSSHYGPGGDRRAAAEKYWNIVKQAYPDVNLEPITAQELSTKGLTFDSGGQTQQFSETARPDFWNLYKQGNAARFSSGKQKNVGTGGYTQQALHEGAQQEVTLNPNVTNALSDIKY